MFHYPDFLKGIKTPFRVGQHPHERFHYPDFLKGIKTRYVGTAMESPMGFHYPDFLKGIKTPSLAKTTTFVRFITPTS